MPTNRRAGRDPDPYTASNLRASAWDAIRAAKRSVRGEGDPSQSDVVKAAIKVASMHMDEWTAAIQSADDAE
jgi:hypothetical protein